jgi:histone-lysine N-methyltransferase SETMAR
VDDVVLLHDNARPHVANRTAARLQSFGWEIMEHAPYSPDLAPSDYHVFGPLKKFLAGQRIISNDDAKTTVRWWFRTQPAEFYNTGISRLVVRWDKCLNRGGDCGKIVKGTKNTAYILISLYVYYCG